MILILIIVAVILFWIFNYSQSTTGIFKSNLDVFFRAIRSGVSISDAEMKMILRRYPKENRSDWWNSSQSKVNDIYKESPDFQEPGASTKKFVYAIFCNEKGTPPTERLKKKYIWEIELIYKKMERENLVWVSKIPKIRSLLESNRNAFPIVISEVLSDQVGLETYADEVQKLNLSQSNKFMKAIKAWQLVSTRDFVEKMGYIKSNGDYLFSDYFFRTLSISLLEEEEMLKNYTNL